MDISFIRENKDIILNNEKNRFNNNTHNIDLIFKLDQTWKSLRNDMDTLNRAKRDISSSIKKCSINEEINTSSDETIIEEIINRKINCNLLTKQQIIHLSKLITQKINFKKNLLNENENMKNELIATLGNMLDPSVKISNNEDENEEISFSISNKTIKIPEAVAKLNHVDLCYRLDFIDTQRGTEIAGNRGYFLKHYGVLFNNALIRYSLDFLIERNYELLYTPFFMRQSMMARVAQLSEYDETLYKIDSGDSEDPLYLIATSEQPITALHQNKYLTDKDLPIKYAGQSTCFRKETGAHGKDTLGIFRVHQFEKIEQFCITAPDKSKEMMQEMISNCKEFYNSLGISYRVVSIVSGALNNAAAIKYDLEAYFPGSNSYRELVSCSNCTDYQSKKVNLKYKDNNSGYVHMLNSTLCANTRTMCCLLETYQQPDGIIVPEVLRKYMNNLEFIKFKN